MSPPLAAFAGASLAVSLAASALPAQQAMDTAFVPRLRVAPAYPRGKGLVVLIDEAHNNFHTASGRYRPVGKLLEADGFVVRPNAAPFDSASLANARVLVIANAVSARNRDDWRLPSHSAFNAAEIAAVSALVQRGGSLLCDYPRARAFACQSSRGSSPTRQPSFEATGCCKAPCSNLAAVVLASSARRRCSRRRLPDLNGCRWE